MNIQTTDFLSPNAAEHFTDSLRHTGFGVITNHPIDFSLVETVYKEWEYFFASNDKQDYLFKKDSQDGFFPQELAENAKGSELQDIKEFYHFYLWGQQPSSLSDATKTLYLEMTKLAGTLLEWVEACTPDEISSKFSIPLSQMIEDSQRTLLRILHYPPLTGAEPIGAVRAAAHEDINLLTLLPAATAKGLEVKDANGNWHEVPCDPTAIVVNAADMLQMASQHYYPSTTHRVVNPDGIEAKKSRLSMPLFLHPRDEVVLADNFTANDYRLQRLKEIGLL